MLHEKFMMNNHHHQQQQLEQHQRHHSPKGDNSCGLIQPKKLRNPCLESEEKIQLHRELRFNQKMLVLFYSNIYKVMIRATFYCFKSRD